MKRRLFKLVVFLLLGAVVNVAVAWGCAARWDNDSHWGSRAHITWLHRSNWVYSGSYSVYFGVTACCVSRYTLDAALETLRERLSKTGLYYWPSENARLPTWSSAAREFLQPGSLPSQLQDRDYVYDIACGLPCRSLRYSATFDGMKACVFEGIRLSSTTAEQNWIGFPPPRALPLRPMWVGLAINTIFYAAILWVLTLGPFTARRLIRRKRGRCIMCGYDLSHAEHEVCPECGWQM